VKHRELIFPLVVLAMTVLGTAVLVLRGDDLKRYLGDNAFKFMPNLSLSLVLEASYPLL
jgi:hypothetical protein